jgi:4-alpha-glucanotransferase
MNVPSLSEGNWRWRCGAHLLSPDLAKKLAAIAEISDRLPQPLPAVVGSHDTEWAA